MSNSRDRGSDTANGGALLGRPSNLIIIAGALIWLTAVWLISHMALEGFAWAEGVEFAGIALGVLVAVVLSLRNEARLRQASEMRLGESERRYRTLFEDSHAIALIIDPERLVIVDANQAAFEFYGYTRDELLNRSVMSLTALTDEDEQAAVAKILRSGGGVLRGPQRLADGRVRDTVNYVGAVTIDGRALLYAICLDVTQERRARKLSDLMRQVDESLLSGARSRDIIPMICGQLAPIYRLSLAWVAASQKDGSMKVYADGPDAERLVRGLPVAPKEPSETESPIGEAMRTGQTVSFRNAELRNRDWQRRLDEAGFSGGAVLPMRTDSEPIGALVLLTKPADSLDDRLLKTLDPVASRLSLVYQNAERQQRMRLQAAAMKAAANGIFVVNRNGRVESINDAMLAMTGYRSEELLGQPPSKLRSGTGQSTFYDDLWRTLRAGDTWRGEVLTCRRDGTLISVNETVAPIPDEHGAIGHFVIVHEDLTARRRAEERSTYLAGHDPLTKLPNRTMFRDRLSESTSRAAVERQSVGLIHVDLDNFKEFNDIRGHDFGDLLLYEVARRIEGAIGPADVAARIGSDEFGIILNGPDVPERLTIVTDGISRAVQEVREVAGQVVRLSISQGAALYPSDGEDDDALIRCADVALGLARAGDPGECRYYAREMGEELTAKVSLRGELRRAIENNEFRLVYQPQVDMRRGTIVGAEALLRWDSPNRGMVSPGVFMPVAEESGLIVPIGDWILEEVCRQIGAWRRAGIANIKVAVNISAVQLYSGHLPDQIAETLARYDVPGQSLEIELTETVLFHEALNVTDQFARLNAMGVRLAIDDFGTGYSSLTYLRRFPVSKLKIDMAFVAGMTTNPSDLAIVRAVISLCKGLGINAIAEGVEMPDQVRALADLGCDQVQGYICGRPLPPPDFEACLFRDPQCGVEFANALRDAPELVTAVAE